MKINFAGNGIRLTAEHEHDISLLKHLVDRTFKASYVVSRSPRYPFPEVYLDEVKEDISSA